MAPVLTPTASASPILLISIVPVAPSVALILNAVRIASAPIAPCSAIAPVPEDNVNDCVPLIADEKSMSPLAVVIVMSPPSVTGAFISTSPLLVVILVLSVTALALNVNPVRAVPPPTIPPRDRVPDPWVKVRA